MGSSSVLAIAGLGVLAGGCDLVFGVTAESTPCDLATFSAERVVDVTPAEDFSLDWEQTFGVVQLDGAAFELDPKTVALTPIDLGPYMNLGLSLAPEGDALFYTINVEPLVLKGALRGGAAAWVLDAGVPRGTFAGTPSADVFGPRRVLVKMRTFATNDDFTNGDDVQEYEDAGGRWMPVGSAHPIAAMRAPNLTPNGLTMVYAGTTAADEPAVLAAQRASTDDWFGEPTPILLGAFSSVQLVERCTQLYGVSDSMLRRYDR